jgi:glycosyltransferase involved in cell wall biosynthesis
VRKHSVRPHNGRIGRILDLYAYERRLLGELLVHIQPDFIHAHWTYDFAMAAIDSKFPYLITAHDDPVAVMKLFRNGYRFGRYLMARSVLRRATAISAVSQDLQNRLASFTKLPIEVVPNPLDRRFIEVKYEQRVAPSKIKQYRFISVINGWSNWKNASSSIRAFSLIHTAMPDTSYHLFGSDFQLGGSAHQWALSKGFLEGLVFHGQVPHAQLIEELKLASVMLHPSRWEACPMGIAEAMALGLPIVGGKNSGGVAWMIDAGGLTVDINKPEEIAEAALRMVLNDDLYLQCSNAAIKRVQQFSPEVVISQYEALYQKSIDTFNGNYKEVVSEPALLPRGETW